MTPIGNTTSAAAVVPQLATPQGSDGPTASFKDLLVRSMQEVNSAQLDANRAVEDLMAGNNADPASVLTAVEKADLAFRMMLQVRNKVMQAFQEVRDIRI
ncbi:MAG TPA: flagellar hook-basal body complex protein FliE [Lacipirellulaceae bacterium]|nr:flagellar hook-basal body complex protein FliE [Lacipirellulaceae bacterium]HMP05052.1 flagellar hook-basal body complex protein FliE [Lacipirellulaceae bacterium]